MQMTNRLLSSSFITTCAVTLCALWAAASINAWAEPAPESVTKPQTSLINDVEQLINQHHYIAATKHVEKKQQRKLMPEEVAKQLLTRIQNESAQYSSSTIQEAYRLSRQNRWAEAENLLQPLTRQVLDKKALQQALESIKKSQNRKLLKSRANTALEKQAWLHQQYKFNQLLNRSTRRNPISRINRYWLEFKLNRHNTRLLSLAKKSNQSGDWKTAKRCLEAMEPEKLEGKTMEQFVELAASTGHSIPIRRNDLNQPNTQDSINVLTNLLEQNIQDNNLLAIKLNLIELAPLTTHRSLHQALIEQAKALLASEISKLDQAADDLYRTEKPREAYEIWEVLLQLDSGNTAIQQKFERAKTVLENMEILRAQGNTSPLPGNE